jgi:hypothetical protein
MRADAKQTAFFGRGSGDPVVNDAAVSLRRALDRGL